MHHFNLASYDMGFLTCERSNSNYLHDFNTALAQKFFKKGSWGGFNLFQKSEIKYVISLHGHKIGYLCKI